MVSNIQNSPYVKPTGDCLHWGIFKQFLLAGVTKRFHILQKTSVKLRFTVMANSTLFTVMSTRHQLPYIKIGVKTFALVLFSQF